MYVPSLLLSFSSSSSTPSFIIKLHQIFQNTSLAPAPWSPPSSPGPWSPQVISVAYLDTPLPPVNPLQTWPCNQGDHVSLLPNPLVAYFAFSKNQKGHAGHTRATRHPATSLPSAILWHCGHVHRSLSKAPCFLKHVLLSPSHLLFLSPPSLF